MRELKKGIYRHYKGGEYEILSEALNTSDKKEIVVYRSIKDKKIWVRDKQEFLAEVEVDKEKKPRFEYLTEGDNELMEQKYLRALADYQNLLRQSAKEKVDFAKFALEDFLHELLPVYDHLKLSIKSLSEEESKSNWVTGVKHVIKQFKDTLKRYGIEEIETEGKSFNHDEMEAVDGEGEKVKAEIMPGYKLHNKVIRAAKVVVE